MRKWMTKDFWLDVLERTVSTFCETLASTLTTMFAAAMIDMKYALIGAAVGTLIAFCKCFVKEAVSAEKEE